MVRKVVFLDRDGVINRDSPDCIKSVAEFEFLPGSLEALQRLSAGGYALIIATNQSALHRGLISAESLTEIHRHLRRMVAARGGAILDIFVCPHRPEEGCACRKPKPGMLLAARRRHAIDFSSAWMIGDSVKDIECGRNAGVKQTVLVRTGNGSAAERELQAQPQGPDLVVADLRAAALAILGR